MILPDINLLVYAYAASAPQHSMARRWWEQVINTPGEPVGLAWVTILGFIRITTNGRVVDPPVSVTRATSAVRTWLVQPHVEILIPGPDHASRLFELLEATGAGGNLTTDAHLAALALEYRAEVATTDADFARFTGVRHFNPLSVKRSSR